MSRIAEPTSAALDEAAALLREGRLVAIPTETVYGLAADARSEAAVRRIFAAKGRPPTHPVIVHLADAGALSAWAAEVPQAAETLAARFWPGPLTLILRRAPHVGDAVTGGQETVGLRVPAHPVARALLERFGSGLAAPSANRYGRVSPTTAAHVAEELGPAIDLILDGGACPVGVESTIVDLSGARPRLLRPGGVPKEAIEAVLGATLVGVGSGPAIRAPGLVASHYAPRAPLEVVDESALGARRSELARQGRRVVVIASEAHGAPESDHISVPAEVAGLARHLYGALREADRRGAEVILVAEPPAAGLGAAIRDRLGRAAAPRP